MTPRVFVNYFTVVRLVLVLLIIGLNSTVAHVGLTYPPARNYDLDFLDNIRTKPPCGMPKGKIGTTLVAGALVNITWHLAYPHRGGYRLELLDKEEKFILDLRTGKNTDEYVLGDPTAQWHTVTIPKDLICEDCTIRLLRQASEWANSYRFWSCADVRIVSKGEYTEDCLGHGNHSENSGCKCDDGYWGPRCQYQDECTSDSDCSTGKCIDLGGTSLPRKQCFCPFGYHGEKCDKSNKDDLPNQKTLSLDNYIKEKLSDKMSMYYKRIPAAKKNDHEIEFVLVVNGTSYGAIGWRPDSLNKTCKMWPYVDDDKEIIRYARQASKSSKVKKYIPNPTLLRPLTTLERSMAEPEPSMRQSSLPIKTKPRNTLEDSKANEVVPSRGHTPVDSIRETEPKPEVEPQSEPEGTAAEPEPEKSAAEPEPEKSAAEPEPEKSAAEPEPEKSAAEPEPEKSAAEPEPEKSAAEPEPEKSAAEPEPEKSAAEPEPERSAAEPEPEQSVANPIPKSKPEITAESEQTKGHKPRKEHDSSAEPEPEHHHDSSAEPEKHHDTASEPESEPEKHHDSSAEPEPELSKSQTNVFSKERKKSSYSPKGDFHAMDCVDIVMGAARGELSRIRDYYTRDRSTPQLDTFWGGTDDLTSVTGWETDEGITYLIFRRKVSSLENTDHDIKGQMHVIWARGQQHGKYVHSPKSGIEAESPSVPNFYSEDEIKYHGHRSQRGVTYIDFDESQS